MTTRDGSAGATDPAVPLIPFPASVRAGTGEPLAVAGTVRLVTDGGSAVVRSVVLDLLSGVGIGVAARDDEGVPTVELVITDEQNSVSEPAGSPESYALSTTAAGARIVAPAPAGLFFGAQTLAQLLANDGTGTAEVAALEIEDAPRFAYRGVMLDVARHFFDVATVTSVIDRIALAKINHLHLHVSDDQGWRVHIDSWPLLTERGATSAVGGGTGGFFSPDDYREIVAYAAERFVTIVPEIDLPGHTHAALVAYPELAPTGYAGAPDATGAPDEPYHGTEVGFSTVDVATDATYRFVADVTRELADLTPGPYLHLGGDESHSTSAEDYLEFLRRASAVAADTGKTLVFWHEAGRSPDLPPGSIGQYWGFVEASDGADALARRFVDRGGRVILSPADAIYLDMKHSEEDPRGLVWADGPTSVRRAYSWDPDDVIPGVVEDAVLGVEAPLWSETIDSLAGIDALAFPRLLAAAEIAWSPRPDESDERTWESFRHRVAAWRPRLEGLGVGFTRADGIEW